MCVLNGMEEGDVPTWKCNIDIYGRGGCPDIKERGASTVGLRVMSILCGGRSGGTSDSGVLCGGGSVKKALMWEEQKAAKGGLVSGMDVPT